MGFVYQCQPQLDRTVALEASAESRPDSDPACLRNASARWGRLHFVRLTIQYIVAVYEFERCRGNGMEWNGNRSMTQPLDARIDEIRMRALAKERELRQQSAGEKTQVRDSRAGIPFGVRFPGRMIIPRSEAGHRLSNKSQRTVGGLPGSISVSGIDPKTDLPRGARVLVLGPVPGACSQSE